MYEAIHAESDNPPYSCASKVSLQKRTLNEDIKLVQINLTKALKADVQL